MYLQPEQALGLVAECAKKFPGGQMLFDLPPNWFAKVSRYCLRRSRCHKAPSMPFSLSLAQAADLVNTGRVSARSAICRCHRDAADCSTPHCR